MVQAIPKTIFNEDQLEQIRGYCKDEASYQALLSIIGAPVYDELTRSEQYEEMLLASDIIDHQTDLICRLKPDGTFSFVNAAYCKLFNKTRDELVGVNFRDLLDEESNKTIDAQLSELTPENPVNAMDYYSEPGGVPTWFRWVDQGIFDEDGTLIEFQTVGRNITQQKLSEERALALALEKERLQVLSRFIQDASHEFKTPVSTIKVNTFLLGRLLTENDDSKTQEYLQRIDQEASNIEELVNSLNEMAELDSNPNYRNEIYNPANVVQQTTISHSEAIATKNLDVTLDIAANLPNLHGDYQRLCVAFAKLVDNAIHYSPDKSKLILRAYHDKKSEIGIEVKDQGVGIVEAKLPIIFDRFYRINDSRTTSGFGLGLAIAKTIVEAHKGRIEVESKVGQGSTFRIILPV